MQNNDEHRSSADTHGNWWTAAYLINLLPLVYHLDLIKLTLLSDHRQDPLANG